MATVEAPFPDLLTRRDLITLGFATRKFRGGQPPRRPRQPDTPLGQPPEGNWFSKKVNRRTVVETGILLVGLGVGAFIADRLGLLSFLHPESERRKKGMKLENLQFNTQDGKKLEKDRFYRVGKIDLQQQTTHYDLILNPQQLIDIADKSGVNKVPEVFRIIIAEQYVSFNQQGQLEEREAEATARGSMITIFIGLDTLFKNAAKGLEQDFEISPEKRAQAEANFNVLVLNQTIVRMLYSATIVSDLDRKGASRQEAEQAIKKATQIVDTFRDEMLNGRTSPAIIVSRSSRDTI